VTASTAQLQTLTRGYRRGLVEGGIESRPGRSRYLDYFFEHDSLVLRGRLGRDEGAIVKCGLDAAADELFRTNPDVRVDPDEHPGGLEPGERNALALAAVAEAALANKETVSAGDCHQVMVHVDLATLSGGDEDGEIEGAGAISADTARRIACDSSFVPLLSDGDKVLNVGRKSRRPSRAIRRALRARDKMCCFPGCANNRFVHAHHIRFYVADHGETSLDNLLLLCPWHHRLVHEGKYTVERDGRGVPVFRRTDGTEVQAIAARPPSSSTEIVAANRAAGVEVDRPPQVPEDTGRRIDWVEAVHTVFFQPSSIPKLPPGVREEVEERERPPGGA
jgi:Domain of unknown function (DUF222)